VTVPPLDSSGEIWTSLWTSSAWCWSPMRPA